MPQVGEKPFSVAGNHPLKFLIRKRGFFSDYCFSLKEGDTVYTRGLYGKPMKIEPSEKALLLAGGSGVAVLPLIAEQLEKLHIPMKIKVGIPEKHDVEALDDVLSTYGEVAYIPDDVFYFQQAGVRDMMKYYKGIYPSFDAERYEKLKEVFQLSETSPIRRMSKGMQKQAAKTRVFTQESLTELQDKMHKYAEREMNEHSEIFEGEDLKEIEKGRNSDWSKEFFVRKKAEALESLNEQYA